MKDRIHKLAGCLAGGILMFLIGGFLLFSAIATTVESYKYGFAWGTIVLLFWIFMVAIAVWNLTGEEPDTTIKK